MPPRPNFKKKKTGTKSFWNEYPKSESKTTSSKIRYLKEYNGEEIQEDTDKEKIFRENWKNISKTLEEENQQFIMIIGVC